MFIPPEKALGLVLPALGAFPQLFLATGQIAQNLVGRERPTSTGISRGLSKDRSIKDRFLNGAIRWGCNSKQPPPLFLGPASPGSSAVARLIFTTCASIYNFVIYAPLPPRGAFGPLGSYANPGHRQTGKARRHRRGFKAQQYIYFLCNILLFFSYYIMLVASN